jgi:hypothetical protein
MRSRYRFATIALAVCLWAGSAAPGFAAGSGTVNAQVTGESACVILSALSVNYGTLPFSSDGGNPSSAGQTISYTNCGGTTEKIYGRGTDATGGNGSATWTLGSPPQLCPDRGLNNYRFGIYQNTSGPPVGIEFSKTDALIETVSAGAAGLADTLYIHMPCVGSSGAGLTMSFQAMFTASF